MRRIEKEIIKREEIDIGAAVKMAKKAGYVVECYDGDGESGPQPPEIVGLYRPSSWAREVENRMMAEVERNR